MDSILYKDVKTTRAYTYHYFFNKAEDGKPTLVFIHGFPSTAIDWVYQARFFREKGFGLIIPDMLGYGGSDKPTDANEYRMVLLAKDIIDIVDHESVGKVIVIGHDWGSLVVSRLAVLHSDRLLGIGFLAVGYSPIMPSYEQMTEAALKHYGSELCGYWPFFCSDKAPKLLEENFDSFFSVLYPHKPELFADVLAPLGKMEKWVEANNQAPLPVYLTEADKKERKEVLIKGGFAAPLCYYKIFYQGIDAIDQAQIPPQNFPSKKPVWFGAALKDYICRPAGMKAAMTQLCPTLTVVDFDTDHWVQLAAPDQVNKELLKWVDTL